MMHLRPREIQANNSGDAAIAFIGVHKYFGGDETSPVLTGIDLEIRVGEIFCLMGTSGSGKSTLLRLVNRLIAPSSGAIRVHGRDLAGLDPAALRGLRAQTVGMVFQDFGLLPHRTALENVELPLELRQVPPAERSSAARLQLERVGLAEAADKHPSQLSGGMRQRVGLARALVGRPDILLMDEPFGALDPTIRRDLRQQVTELVRRNGITTLLVTHDPAEALAMADRIAVLRDGVIVQVATPEEIVAHPADAGVADFFGGAVDADAPATRQPAAVAEEDTAAEPAASGRSRLAAVAAGPARFAAGRPALFWAGLLIEALLAAALGASLGNGWPVGAALAAAAILLARGLWSLVPAGGAEYQRHGPILAALLLYAIDAIILARAHGSLIAGDFGLPLADRSRALWAGGYLDAAVAATQVALAPVFAGVVAAVRSTIDASEALLGWLPWPVPALALVYAAGQFAGRAVFALTVVAVAYLVLFGYWPQTIATVSLVGAAVALTVIVGVPVGVLMARSRLTRHVLSPLLDVMQTLPSFVYLIPAVAFFSVGKTPAVVATIVFSLPPMIRLTALGITEVPRSAVEAAVAHGATPLQTLIKVELPLAARSLLLGVNQTIVMSLSMVVIAAMIGAGGLGYDVVTALRNIQSGAGLLAGLAIVFCALVPDRIIQGAMRRWGDPSGPHPHP
ncbi:ABC transporter, quaternary amine uptake transporter (QAT) family, ATPase/permease fusion protein [uncultured Pleomorphomonas sp.]|uniref:ABC transporter, quaternary amine uptake transporter (QAT) family, ATPase/permease fusion protein n=1 Tax=uncultured Pleomorphomonas sp. TaxID=442121 RepID=A0A212LEU5_9HYPH|nr:ATP-binding cassette domain-containing protein [uncultured Pleomorphomonas sp.]SCM76084.1 ABC transporter, quaternary amine uptake transporter (QAT) family, ATPase/permease fusion protein [uncultured Pleomorphomonas sp.]